MKDKTTINSKAYQYLLSLVGDNKVLDLYVMGKWLCAELPHCRFMVKNTNYD